MAAKKAAARENRTRMTDEQCDKFIAHYAKEHDLKGKELEVAVHRCAATRWAALERNASKHPAKEKKKAAKK